MPDIINEMTSELQNRIALYQPGLNIQDIGIVLEAGDGIATVKGLGNVRSQELVEFNNGVKGIAFNLEKEKVGVIILGDYSEIVEGMQVRTTGRIASVPVGDKLIGRVVNALGEPIDGKGAIESTSYRPVEKIAPGVVERQDVDAPVQTGILAIDAMIPIGRGQRELIIGDRQTGKTALAVDTIINQNNKGLICIYVAIGQKKAAIARTISVLEQHGAMEHTIIVAAPADDPAALQYIAPYAGCAIGEEFMETGRDALVVYDDLSKHAWAYRQISLLLRRPPGREAYPGDVFYLHSRLLERASRMARRYIVAKNTFSETQGTIKDAVEGKEFTGPLGKHNAEEYQATLEKSDTYKVIQVKGSGGSLTALPIIETLLGDVAAYVPTNVISITDGQIYLESNLFNGGIRPAINVGISVSRVGGDAQTKAMKKVAGRLRLDMANYRELAGFAQLGSDLDKATMTQLNRGVRLQEILKQAQYEPVPLEEEVIMLYAGTNGFTDQVPVDRIREWKKSIIQFMRLSHPEICNAIADTKVISPDVETNLKQSLEDYIRSWK